MGKPLGLKLGRVDFALVKSFPRLLVCPSAFSRPIAIIHPMSPFSMPDPQLNHCEHQTSHAHDPLDGSPLSPGHPVGIDDIVNFHMPAVAPQRLKARVVPPSPLSKDSQIEY
ncbi:hypothetical protein BJY01DRAFT_221633 [Aspergillus pseudoustus]|uniref:Uncharacterized protein n=1 Tax=Aspergillus pseudoustus TaxID=1810923 RepID=A0ABR4J9I3_9EURO